MTYDPRRLRRTDLSRRDATTDRYELTSIGSMGCLPWPAPRACPTYHPQTG